MSIEKVQEEFCKKWRRGNVHKKNGNIWVGYLSNYKPGISARREQEIGSFDGYIVTKLLDILFS